MDIGDNKPEGSMVYWGYHPQTLETLQTQVRKWT